MSVDLFLNEIFDKSKGKEKLTFESLCHLVEEVVSESGKPFLLNAETAAAAAGEPLSFDSMGSAAEAAEACLCFGMVNRDLLGGGIDVDPKFLAALKSQSGGVKKVSEAMFKSAVLLGAKIGAAGGVAKAEGYGQGGDSGAEEESKTGLNMTPKTDIIVDGLRMSVKDAAAGYQAEAISTNSFKPLFDAAFDSFAKKYPDKEYLQVFGEEGKEGKQQAADLFKGVLDDYRTNPAGHGDAMNSLFGLKGGKSVSDEEKETMRTQLEKELQVELHNTILDGMISLFKDPDFKKEFIRQAITGQYKFKDGDQKSIADHILYFNLSNMTFQVRPIDDAYINEAAEKFTWQIRTGKRKAAPVAGKDHYTGSGKDAVVEKVDGWLTDILSFAKENTDVSSSGVDALRVDLQKAHASVTGRTNDEFFLKCDDEEEGCENQTGINQFFYEFLKYSGKKVNQAGFKKKVAAQGGIAWEDFYKLLWEGFTGGAGFVKGDPDDPEAFTGFKGRDGRFGTDVKGDKKGELTDKFNEDVELNEGWFADSLKKVWQYGKDAVKTAFNWLAASGSEMLSALGFSIGEQTIELPEPKMDNSFVK